MSRRLGNELTPLVVHGLGRPHLGRSAALALLGEHLAVGEQLATPDAPRLAPHLGRLEAGLAHRARPAEGLGPRDVIELLGEEQFDERRRTVATSGVEPPGLVFCDLDGEHRRASPVFGCRLGRLLVGRGLRWLMGPGTQKGRRVAPAAWWVLLR